MSDLDAFLGNDFDYSSPEQSINQTVPDGEYLVQITDCSLGKTQKQDTAIIVTYSVLTGQYDGSVVKEWFNVENEKQKVAAASRTAFQYLAAMCGFNRNPSTYEMVGKRVRIKIEKNEKGYPSVKGHYSVQNAAPVQATAAPAPTAQPAAAGVPPWAKQ